MIYGLNFGRADIPAGVRRHFASRKRFNVADCVSRSHVEVTSKTVVASLAGTATEATERDTMLIIADNGRRLIFVVERRTAAGVWYGIYTY